MTKIFRINNEEEYIRNTLFDFSGDSSEEDDELLDDIGEFVEDTDFSDITGDFKKSFQKVNKKLSKRKKRKPLTKSFGVNKKAKIVGGKKKITKVIVPSNRKTIVEGVSKFILNQSDTTDSIKSLGYYKGEKLKELNFTFNNGASNIDFNFELFNPSEPLDYYQATSLNLNDKITLGGNQNIAYSDLLFNILANPTMIVNAKLVFSGASVASQINQPFIIKNKSITAEQIVNPLNIGQQIDAYQYQPDIVVFDFASKFNRPYIPDGMDVIAYKVLAGMTVTFAFFYKQHQLKKVFFEEARKSKSLL